jgi:hypothetical protein
VEVGCEDAAVDEDAGAAVVEDGWEVEEDRTVEKVVFAVGVALVEERMVVDKLEVTVESVDEAAAVVLLDDEEFCKPASITQTWTVIGCISAT